MEMPQRRYKVRSGTTDSGKEYEIKMAALLALRCIPNTRDFWIASNADGVGAFDDIILQVTIDENASSTFLLQLKHKDDPNNLTKAELEASSGKFALNKYCEDIAKLRDVILEKGKGKDIVGDLGSFSDIYFVLFTNRGMEVTKVQKKNWYLEVDSDDSQKSILKKVLNTDLSHGAVFRFVLPNIPKTISSGHNKDCKNFRLLTNQISEKNLDEGIVEELKKIVPSNSAKISLDSIAENLVKYVKDWTKGSSGNHYYLTKKDVVFKLTQLFLSHYEVSLRREQFSTQEKSVWNDLVRDKAITVVDSSETVLNFAIRYIGGEVIEYCHGFAGNWADKFPEKCQKMFWKHNSSLRIPMLKIVGNREKLTLVDVYKCLWCVQKLPLLVKIDSAQDYEELLDVLKLSDYSYKVIILTTDSVLPTDPEHGIKIFRTLQDLTWEERKKILDQSATLQGRPLDKLQDHLDESMFEHIKCSDIIRILMGIFNIGNEFENLPEYFIQRCTTRIFISSQVLLNVGNDKFILSNCNKDYLDELPMIGSDSIILFEDGKNAKQIEELKSSGRNVHCFSVCDKNCLEWKWTVGKTDGIRSFQTRLDGVFESDVSCYFSNHTNIISEVPGMGKSFLMDYIAHRAPATKWVLRIDLNAHRGYYKSNDCKNPNTKAWKHLNYFYDRLGCNNSELSRKVFEKMASARDVVVLLDGFDEISISHKDEVTNLAKSLQREGFYIWLTTRPHMKLHLEEEFGTFAISLRPFTDDDQKNFLVKYFSHQNSIFNRDAEIEMFVSRLLQATKKNLQDNDTKFTGIPLQTRLLADYFNEKCQNFLSNPDSVNFNERFDLLSLYQNFIDGKLKAFCEKFGEGSTDARKTLEGHQKLFALKFVFVLDDFGEMEIFRELDDYDQNNLNRIQLLQQNKSDKIQLLQQDGIITADEMLNMGCIHRTFAEYLSAQWLSENLNPEDEVLRDFVHTLIKRRFTHDYSFLFSVFDRILAKSCPLHSKIINEQMDEAKMMIESDPGCATEIDHGGRTILHMAALYDDQDLLGNYYAGEMKYDVMGIVQAINHPELYSRTDVAGYTALDYALANNSSLILANAICKKSKISSINAWLDLDFCLNYLTNCENLRLKALFDVLVPYFASRDLLQNKTGNINLKYYLQKKGYINKSSVYVKKLPPRMSVLEFLKSKGGLRYSEKFRGYPDLRYAILFGTEENVERLASSSQEINKRDVDSNTPLHYAVLFEKTSIVKILLSKGADVNIRNFNNQTSLHLAFATRNLDIMKLCLSQKANFNAVDKKGKSVLHYAVGYGDCGIVKELASKADINKQDGAGNTPLYLALEENHTDITKLLIEAGADIKITNNNGRNVLHHAVRYNYKHFIFEIAFRRANRNVQDGDGNTPIHLELSKGSPDFEILEFLLSDDADVNIQNIREETPLHLALNKTFAIDDSIVELLLKHGANVNVQNCKGESAVHCAIRSGNASIVPRLLPNFGDVNQRNCFRDTCLHLASKNGETKIVSPLIFRGAEVNVQNSEGKTPLHCASETNVNYTNTMSMLLSKGADINKRDFRGNTSLHLAVLSNNTFAVKLLLDAGANVRIKNRKGETPLDLARKSDFKEVLLCWKGFKKNDPSKRGLNNFDVQCRPHTNEQRVNCY